jgi:hypothetical protein
MLANPRHTRCPTWGGRWRCWTADRFNQGPGSAGGSQGQGRPRGLQDVALARNASCAFYTGPALVSHAVPALASQCLQLAGLQVEQRGDVAMSAHGLQEVCAPRKPLEVRTSELGRWSEEIWTPDREARL